MDFISTLNTLRQQYRESLDDETLTLIDQGIVELSRLGIIDQSLKIGDQVPNFTLPNTNHQRIELYHLLEQGSVVISFFRGIWCPFCLLELEGLEQALPAIRSLGATLIGISPQKQNYSSLMVGQQNFTFDILSDQGNQVAHQFGIVYQLPEYLKPVFEQGGYPLPRYNGDESFELPIPATFAVNPAGKVIYAFTNPDYTQRVDAIEVVSILRKAKAGG